jgi:hypothetical protein
MTRRVRSAQGVALAAIACACAPIDDQVFSRRILLHEDEPLVLIEGAGQVEIPVRLAVPARAEISARYRFVEREAQTTCRSPDFLSPDGRVAFAAGSDEGVVSLWIGNDELPELDEGLTLVLDDFQGGDVSGSDSIELVILDDDRSGIVEARSDFGLAPGGASDQSAALQAALDRAGELGRAVVRVEPGDYDISGVTLLPGTTLSGRGAHFRRPAASSATAVSIALAHSAPLDSESSLVEGVTLDGRRDEQGPYEDNELAEAHLLSLRGNPESAGLLLAAVEGVRVESSTASGVFLGPGVDATICRLQAEDLWRDVVTLRGGGTRVDAREIDASATSGTSGLWFDGQPAGFGGTHRIEVIVEDTQLASGDLEIEAYEGSSIVLERFSMTRGPLRIQAPDATVRISESVLQTGLPSAIHNFFGLPHDVTITLSTLVTSETDLLGAPAPAADRDLAVVSVRWELESNPERPPLLPSAPPPHRILFDRCTFLRGPDLDPSDTVAAVESTPPGGTVLLRSPTLGPSVTPLAPTCDGCTLE